MTRHIFTFFIVITLTKSFSQSTRDISKILVGEWVIEKIDLTVENKKEVLPIEDTSNYVFKANGTYTLSCKDLWGKAKIVGKWQPDSGDKVKLYDIIHISDVKGPLAATGVDQQIEIKIIENKQVLFLSSYDKELEWLHELYYKKVNHN